MARIHLLSDPHLSPTHGFFWENWRIARDAANAAAPGLVAYDLPALKQHGRYKSLRDIPDCPPPADEV